MATRKRIRRKIKRKAPAVRRAQPGQAGRGGSSSELLIGGMMDPAEKAADHMAHRALSGQAPVNGATTGTRSGIGAAVKRMCGDCAEEEEGGKVKRAATATPAVAAGSAAAAAPKQAAAAVDAMGSGRRLSVGERSFFEPRFGRDFADVRIHEGSAATRATRALDARAFAKGTEIAFAPGERTPQTMAHELAHVVQDENMTRRSPVLRRACGPCPSPVNPIVKATIQPIVSYGTPTGSKWGSTNWPSSSKGLGVSIAHREKRTCDKQNVSGKDHTVWDVCPKKIKLRASVGMVLDKAEIRRKQGKKRWWMECGAPAGKMLFTTKADAKTKLTTPKRITVGGVLHHEKYHVKVSKKVLEKEIKARVDLTKQIVPYSQPEIAKWKTALMKTLNTFQETRLKANPSEPNEELNASTAECTRY